MRSILLLIIAIAAGIFILSTIVPIIGLLISLAIVYYSIRRFLLSKTVGGKIGWAIVGLIGLSMTLSNVPALIGVGVIIFLYYAYEQSKTPDYETEDPDWIID